MKYAKMIEATILPSSALLFVLLLLSIPTNVTATFSIVATDATTRQVGGAGASCNPSGDIYSGLYLSAPNRSVLHTQALLLERSNPIVRKVRDMMKGGDKSIDEILGAMEEMEEGMNMTLSVGSFPTRELRQYGIADFTSNAGYTGQSIVAAYTLAGMADNTEQVDIGSTLHLNGRLFSYHALGNDVHVGTTQSLENGFLEEVENDEAGAADDTTTNNDCIMAQRLMSALDNVLHNNHGDMRCINDHNGISSTGAYIHIDNPNGKALLHINKAGDGSYEPIVELKKEFMEWKVKHGCYEDDGMILNNSGGVEMGDIEVVAGENEFTTKNMSNISKSLLGYVSFIILTMLVGIAAMLKKYNTHQTKMNNKFEKSRDCNPVFGETDVGFGCTVI